jgi:hypothetical protein
MTAGDHDTEELATRAATGDTGARDTLLIRIAPQVMRQCQRILPCRQDAEEACQDALLQVALRISTFDGRAGFSRSRNPPRNRGDLRSRVDVAAGGTASSWPAAPPALA